MKIAFLGGGSLRLLPLLRGLMAEVPQILNNGELRFVDLNQDRANAVANLVKASPESQKFYNLKIVCPDSLEDGLHDIDVLYLTMGARREPTETIAMLTAHKYGYHSSDQLSINGGFLAMCLGKTILNIAQKMEKLCPKALMLIFANPVAVYSAMINNYTKIKALGICGGFGNHKWDLTRLFFLRNMFDPKWEVIAAGVNHLSFILRGSYDGEDLYSSLCPRFLNDSWKPLEGVEFSTSILNQMYRRYRTMIFSTELDGIAHVFPEIAEKWRSRVIASKTPFDPQIVEKHWENIQIERFNSLILNSKHPEQVEWNNPDWQKYYGKNLTDISIPIFKALGKVEKTRIVASRPNRGAVQGFADEASLEYTMELFGDTIIPVENQYVPDPFHGIVTSLSDYQTLLAKAIVEESPALFANALDTYPVHQFMPQRKDFFREMCKLYGKLIPDIGKTLQYFN